MTVGDSVLLRYPALRTPAFRWLLVALTLAELGFFAVQTAIIWLVQEHTGSPAFVGVLVALLSLAFLVGVLPVGIVADRTGPQRTMLLAMVGASIVVGVAAVLTLVDALIPVVAFGLAIASGLMAVIIWVPGQLLAARLVGRSEVTSALGLRYVPVGIAWLIGGAMAGVTLELAGAPSTFLIVALVLLLASAIVYRLPRLKGLETSSVPAPGQLLIAFRYVARRPLLLGLIALVGVVGMFVMSRMAVYPALVSDVLLAGPGALGAFMAVHGLGAFAGALSADPLGALIGRGRTAILALTICGAGLIGVGVSDDVVIALVFAGVATAGLIAHLGTGAAIVQLATPPRMRGRVVATYDFSRFLMIAVGSLVAGILADAIGPSLVFVLFGLMTVAGALAVRVADPDVWRLRVDAQGRLATARDPSRA